MLPRCDARDRSRCALTLAGRGAVRDRGVAIDLVIDEGAGVESLNAHGAQYVWTRKQAGRTVIAPPGRHGASPRPLVTGPH